MTLTLLLDLDDTLLENEIQVFLPRYLEAFGQFVAPHVDSQKFVEALLAGTRKMTQNQRVDCTLKEVFDEVFYSRLPVNPLTFRGLIDEFYVQVFPSLKSLTRPIPGARDFVEQAVERGYHLSLATNPLFPRTAIEQRLAWADLPVERFPFEEITSYERYHFAKPDPAYFAEILAYLRWPEEKVVMIGDDFTQDISGASRLGLPTYWISNDIPHQDASDAATTGGGSLAELLPWLNHTPAEVFRPDYTSHSALLASLRSTPAFLDGISRSLDMEMWRRQPAVSSWSLTEVICHLRDVDTEVNLRRLRRLLEEKNPFLPSEDTDPWAIERNYALQDGKQALRQFMDSRIKLVDLLSGIDPDAWERKARHAIFGPTNLHELVCIVTGHDRLHVRQVHEILDVISSRTQ